MKAPQPQPGPLNAMQCKTSGDCQIASVPQFAGFQKAKGKFDEVIAASSFDDSLHLSLAVLPGRMPALLSEEVTVLPRSHFDAIRAKVRAAAAAWDSGDKIYSRSQAETCCGPGSQ